MSEWACPTEETGCGVPRGVEVMLCDKANVITVDVLAQGEKGEKGEKGDPADLTDEQMKKIQVDIADKLVRPIPEDELERML